MPKKRSVGEQLGLGTLQCVHMCHVAASLELNAGQTAGQMANLRVNA